MIIKSKTRKVPSFGQLISYMLSDGKEPAFVLKKNVFGETPEEWIRSFQVNERKRRKRSKNSVVIYHEIVSLAEKDNSKVSDEMLQDIAIKYLRNRHPKAMMIAVGHRDQENPHFHVMISGLELGSSKAASMSKGAFEQMKLELENYQRAQYPELESVEHDRGLDYIQTGTTKEKIRRILTQTRPSDWAKHDLEPYHYRGKMKGVLYRGRKYRFKTLGLDKNDLELLPEIDR